MESERERVFVVSLFNDISIFVGNLMLKPSLVVIVNLQLMGITRRESYLSPGNTPARVEFEIAY